MKEVFLKKDIKKTFQKKRPDRKLKVSNFWFYRSLDLNLKIPYKETVCFNTRYRFTHKLWEH